ncbi:hypothetical protein N0V85_003391 [Neurospora sp. IMI 360204]|nr:hypothetical protein N0V85_003391 [Neurospora sp. IMI 360204]
MSPSAPVTQSAGQVSSSPAPLPANKKKKKKSSAAASNNKAKPQEGGGSNAPDAAPDAKVLSDQPPAPPQQQAAAEGAEDTEEVEETPASLNTSSKLDQVEAPAEDEDTTDVEVPATAADHPESENPPPPPDGDSNPAPDPDPESESESAANPAEDTTATTPTAAVVITETNGHAPGGANGHIPNPSTTTTATTMSTTTSPPPTEGSPVTNSTTADEAPANTTTTTTTTNNSTETSAKLEAMSQDRETLRAEVEQLRKQLESIQSTHDEEVSQLRSDLEESEAAKEHAETQYQNLLGRVEKIKETLGERLKRDRARVEELETANEELQQAAQTQEEESARLREQVAEQAREIDGLRSRTNLSQQNWGKEREDLEREVEHLRSELKKTSAAMGEWEVIAMEERSMREGLEAKATDLEEQLVNVREAYERVAEERNTQSQAIDGLQRALQEIQEARKRELREMVESSEEQLAAMKKRAEEADAKAKEAQDARESLQKELERTAPFEKEVKEKNLLIGKLRHEAIVLNDHLTKALKYIKKMKPEETIDRQIVTNHLLQFLSLDRSDPKKFQILQVIAGLLNWTDEQREQAGLARPGGSGGGLGSASSLLRLPTSPFHRTPSSPSLNHDFFSDMSTHNSSTMSPTAGSVREGSGSTGGGGRESLADLWAGFLERSVEEASAQPPNNKRKDSMSSTGTGNTSGGTHSGFLGFGGKGGGGEGKGPLGI